MASKQRRTRKLLLQRKTSPATILLRVTPKKRSQLERTLYKRRLNKSKKLSRLKAVIVMTVMTLMMLKLSLNQQRMELKRLQRVILTLTLIPQRVKKKQRRSNQQRRLLQSNHQKSTQGNKARSKKKRVTHLMMTQTAVKKKHQRKL